MAPRMMEITVEISAMVSEFAKASSRSELLKALAYQSKVKPWMLISRLLSEKEKAISTTMGA